MKAIAWFGVNSLVLGMICLVLGISCAWFVVIAFVMIVFGLAFVTKVFVVNGLCVASFCNKKFGEVMSYICSCVKCMSSP
jgi:hypothetical protein